VVAESLFTHQAEEARSYLAEIRAVRPGALLCVSVFLLISAARAITAGGAITGSPPRVMMSG
jgi:hypothetical protein